MATIRDVARAAGVSIATVSRVFNSSTRVNESTALRVWKAAGDLDYWPNGAARSLSTHKTNTLGILMPDLFGEFFSEVIRGIDHLARREKYQTLISSSHANAEEIMMAARAMRGRIDGLIMMAPDDASAETVEKISKNVPVVLLNPRFEMANCCSVSIANFNGAHMAVEHLIGLGHVDIAIITGPAGNVDAEERLRGYQQALQDAGLTPAEDLVLRGDFRESSGYSAAPRILSRDPRPTAVFACNDSMAVGLISALRNAEVEVPRDMAVVGFDNIAIAQYLTPPLTTVHVDAYALGQKAVQMMLASMRSPDQLASTRQTLQSSLKVRGSCGSRPDWKQTTRECEDVETTS